jgi:uncharacterized membrane protein
MVRIKDFAESRNVDMKAVSRWMKVHNMPYDRSTGLTEEQISILDKKYPLPKPIEIIEDTESRKMLIETQKALIEAQNALILAQSKIAQAEAQKLLLEDREKQIDDLQQEIKSFKRTWFGLYKKRPQV